MAPTTIDTNILPAFPDLGARVAAVRHPIYDALQDEWIKLGDVREGVGGFKDGRYLHAHPREWEDHAAANPKKPSKKLKNRRAIAAYDNIAAAILDSKKSALFRESPIRRCGTGEMETLIEQWWKDVDGDGTHIDECMPAWWDLAATFGHVVLYFELPDETGLTAADTTMPYIRVYTPLDVINWLTDDDGKIISIKVVEAVPTTEYVNISPTNQYRIRIIDEQGWKLYNYREGKAIEQGQHNLGMLPCAYLFGRRRSILTDVGQSVLGDPRNYIDLFNLRSELRELLRNQTFSFINLPLGVGPDAMTVEQAQNMLGQQTGTMNVLFSAQPAGILTGDAANVTAYQDEIAQVTREIHRQAGVPWEGDSKAAQAAQSMELRREELNIRLAAYADECEQTEKRLADLFYRWQYGAEMGPEWIERDRCVVHYPDRFGSMPFDEILKQIQSAQSIGMPDLFMKELRKQMIAKFEGMADLDPDTLKSIVDAIDMAPPPATPQDLLRERLNQMAAAGQGNQNAVQESQSQQIQKP